MITILYLKKNNHMVVIGEGLETGRFLKTQKLLQVRLYLSCATTTPVISMQ